MTVSGSKKVFLASVAVLAVPLLCYAAIMSGDGGTWPDDWPSELEPLRDQAVTNEVMHGIQETVYEIPFGKREEFENAWPHILKVKSKGAPLILEKTPSSYGVSGSTMETGVRLLCPPTGAEYGKPGCKDLPEDKGLIAGPPWPQSLMSPTGELPEYVATGLEEWLPFDESQRETWRIRARIDIVLVTDGKIVDLNRIRLPEDTPIIDRRFTE